MNFRLTDAGRAGSRTPKERNDCTVRVLALACNLSYDQAHQLLAEHGRKWGRGFNLPDWFRHVGHVKTPDRLYLFRWRGFPSIKGRKRMTQAQFARDYPSGSYIVSSPKHIECWVDGVLHDDKPGRLDRCIYGAWEVLHCSPASPLWMVRGQRPGAPSAKRLGVVTAPSAAQALDKAVDWFGHLKTGPLSVERMSPASPKGSAGGVANDD